MQKSRKSLDKQQISMMSEEELKERISEKVINCILNTGGSVSENLKDEDLQDSNKLMYDIGLDSLDCVELVCISENEFEISISDDEYEPMKEWTLGQYIDFIYVKIRQ
jgi:acyl carrier protein